MSSNKIHKLLSTNDSNIITTFNAQSFIKSIFYRENFKLNTTCKAIPIKIKIILIAMITETKWEGGTLTDNACTTGIQVWDGAGTPLATEFTVHHLV